MITEEESATGSDEGENYFVAMTDMMVGVLFIFILMLMAFALDFRRTTDKQEDALLVAQQVAAKLDTLQADMQRQMTQLDRTQQDRRKLLLDIREQLAAEGLSVQIDEASGGAIELVGAFRVFEHSGFDPLALLLGLNGDTIALQLLRCVLQLLRCPVRPILVEHGEHRFARHARTQQLGDFGARLALPPERHCYGIVIGIHGFHRIFSPATA